MADNKVGVPVLDYYRTDPRAGGKVAGPAGVPTPDVPTFDEANVANAGPLRALFGKLPIELEVKCPVSALGVVNRPTPLIRNDYDKPVYVRIRLARNSAEGRIAIGTSGALDGSHGGQPMEWLDLTKETGQKYEAMLLSGNALFAIGTWVGLVPLSIFVTVTAWNP
jgi:hypothetical protein